MSVDIRSIATQVSSTLHSNLARFAQDDNSWAVIEGVSKNRCIHDLRKHGWKRPLKPWKDCGRCLPCRARVVMRTWGGQPDLPYEF